MVQWEQHNERRYTVDFFDQLGITGSPAITVICFLAAEILKQFSVKRKWIPVYCACLGGILGLGALFLFPDYPDDNLYSAVSVGIVSGFAATGVHQVYKKLISAATNQSSKQEVTQNGK